MPTPLEQFIQFLHEKGLRLTREREIIVVIALSIDSPFDTDHVIEAVRFTMGRRRVSRSTVYRTLTMLEECGLIQRNPAGNGYVRPATQSSGSLVEVSDRLVDDARVVSLEVCTRAHANLIAGNCPWCNRAIINGEVEE
jgi:Fe2+ or Zn2+ uptake regulation protein